MTTQGQVGGPIKPGIYERLVTEELNRLLGELDAGLVSREPLDPADSHEMLARHVTALVARALRSVPAGSDHPLQEQLRLANRIIEAIAGAAKDDHLKDLVAGSADVLHAVAASTDTPAPVRFADRPDIPLSASALLVNGREQPRIGSEVQKELASADRVDLLCAFVKWHGLRVLEEALEALTRRGGRLRVITTTYIGATERKALDRRDHWAVRPERRVEPGLLEPHSVVVGLLGHIQSDGNKRRSVVDHGMAATI